ncbi:hypothetical protein H2200_006632 [Cladophialophora chaetospira]|uniref:Heterokaryon incompatibility domain-containing protein n=1 Tax=Cladophialophora chaetospira TaxID=386627 RepID=A0AA39CI42_9EURO|nr:hypothetical protein H2200_006632 [Cladophialophora chaetospira]
MDLIYERAYLTVVAANSPSANSGLPGVMAPRRLEQKVYHMKPNLSFAILSPLGVHLKKSTWGSRGWTLQEQHLSRRTLNFVNNQVYFQCRESLWSEDRTTDRRPEGKTHLDMDDQLINIIKESMDEMLDSTSPYELLFTILETFQKRTLTLDSDAYNAVAGFLPRVAEAEAGGEPRLIHRPAHIKHEFPIETVAELTDSVVASITTPFAPVGICPGKTTTVTQCSLQDTRRGNPIPETCTPTNLPYNLLIFNTFSVYMKVGSLIETENSLNSYFELLDKDESLCGQIIPDYLSDFHILTGNNGDTDSQTEEATAISLIHEFALISGRRVSSGYAWERVSTPEDTYWILMIEWIEEKGVYERRGLGHIQKTSVENSFAPGMRWKTIVLG